MWRDHLSRHMSDGNIDFTMMKYDEGTRSKESTASGDGPCIHHFAIEAPICMGLAKKNVSMWPVFAPHCQAARNAKVSAICAPSTTSLLGGLA